MTSMQSFCSICSWGRHTEIIYFPLQYLKITYLVCSARIHMGTHCISFSSVSTFWIYLPWNIFPAPGTVFHELILSPVQENYAKGLTKKSNKCLVKLMINYIHKGGFLYTFFSFLWPHLAFSYIVYLHFFKHDTWIAFYEYSLFRKLKCERRWFWGKDMVLLMLLIVWLQRSLGFSVW